MEKVKPSRHKAIEGKFTALMLASKLGNLQTVHVLLKFNADFNIQDSEGLTALMFASQKGHFEIAEFLLKTGADFQLENCESETALSLAFKNGHLNIINILKNHVDRNYSSNKECIRHIACAIQSLKETDVNKRKLIQATLNEDCNAIQSLLKLGVDVNARNESGQTPLIIASQNGLL
ncbi:ankyrin repeat domain-containing protein 29 [Biomphalaria glabrata]|nr:ankyrin repeat domain-containing protein 29-like [Biomphalaria glabrata]